MTVLVTGGNGFIGSRVVRLLVEDGRDVRCLLRPGARTNRIDDLAYTSVTGDVLDGESLERALVGVRSCIHLASMSGWHEILGPDVERSVVDGTRRVVDALIRAGCPRLVYVSSAAAIGASDRPLVLDEHHQFNLDAGRFRYAAAKAVAERTAHAASQQGVEVVTVNPVETFGPDDVDLITAGTLRSFLEDWPVTIVRGGTSVAYVEDVARGIVLGLDRGRAGERYILGGDNLTLREMAHLTLELAGRAKPIITVPRRAARLAMRGIEALGLRPPIAPGMLDYAGRYWFMDSSKAQTELGYRSRLAVEALEPTVRWLIARRS